MVRRAGARSIQVIKSVLVLSTVTLAACGGSPTSPTPPVKPVAPTLTCPADMQVTSPDGHTATVEFSPTVADGTPPVTITCTPASGTTFVLGPTPVSCTATDAEQRTSTCAFSVVVEPPPHISVTRFMAFGDSITEGDPSVGPAYPTLLGTELSNRYTAQQIVVFNEGHGGEMTTDGEDRIKKRVAIDNPQVVLILEGVNDINFYGESGESTVIFNLQRMVRSTEDAGATPFLATLLPQRPGGQRAYAPDLIAPTNEKIRAIQGAVLVDLYAAFGGEAGTLIGPDGLHPSASGYQKIAETFLDAIRMRFEAPSAPMLRAPWAALRP